MDWKILGWTITPSVCISAEPRKYIKRPSRILPVYILYYIYLLFLATFYIFIKLTSNGFNAHKFIVYIPSILKIIKYADR